MYYHIINDCDIELWGVPQRERIEKTVAKVGDFQHLVALDSPQFTGNVLLIRADYLFDANVLTKLLQHSSAILMSSDDQKPVAAWVDIAVARECKTLIAHQQPDTNNISIPSHTPQSLTGGYDPRLRKFDLSHVVKITRQHQRIIENYLYDKSYKGITDLVTKWFWPLPAKWFVRKCVAFNVSPNMVTSIGWVLTFLVGLAFYYGYFVLGLLMAWVMTFLDTVDGKLARVTLQTSKLGHVMDHGLDILHPPAWYWCWAAGLQIDQISFFDFNYSTVTWFWFLFAAYVGGRIFEGLFQLSFNDISIFCWRPIDSYHRLVTARRNPCLILLSIAIVLQSPIEGFIWIVIWTIVSTIFLGVRFSLGGLVRLISGPLKSWIAQIDPEQRAPSLATRWFTGYPALKTIEPIIRTQSYN